MKSKLFDYVEKDNLIFNLSGVTKLICFICLTFSVMFSYDIRVIMAVMAISVLFFIMSRLEWKQIKIMVIYVIVFLLFNFILTFVFSPHYGVEIYGTKHEIFRFNERYTLTLEQLLYQITKLAKYASVVPLGLIFLLTTNPSEFAASMNRIGLNYKAAFAISLTLRYFPDLIRNYQDISLAQQSRGLDLSKKEKLPVRIKNTMNICVPLLFSTLERIELISNAMDLRGFGKNKNRTWYSSKSLKKQDFIAILIALVFLIGSISVSLFINHSRFYNPFI